MPAHSVVIIAADYVAVFDLLGQEGSNSQSWIDLTHLFHFWSSEACLNRMFARLLIVTASGRCFASLLQLQLLVLCLNGLALHPIYSHYWPSWARWCKIWDWYLSRHELLTHFLNHLCCFGCRAVRKPCHLRRSLPSLIKIHYFS